MMNRENLTYILDMCAEYDNQLRDVNSEQIGEA